MSASPDTVFVIPKEILLERLDISNVQFFELLRSLDFKSNQYYTEKQVKLLTSFCNRMFSKNAQIRKLDFITIPKSKYEKPKVSLEELMRERKKRKIEKQQVCTKKSESIILYPEIQEPKKETSKKEVNIRTKETIPPILANHNHNVQRTVVQKRIQVETLIDGFKRVNKTNCAAFWKDSKILFYSCLKFPQKEDLIQFDLTIGFTKNMKIIKDLHPNKYLYFFTNMQSFTPPIHVENRKYPELPNGICRIQKKDCPSIFKQKTLTLFYSKSKYPSSFDELFEFNYTLSFVANIKHIKVTCNGHFYFFTNNERIKPIILSSSSQNKIAEGFIKCSRKEASLIYNDKQEPKEIFYSFKKIPQLNDLILFDLTLPFYVNLENLKKKHIQNFFLFTNNKRRPPIIREKSTKPCRVFTKEEDEKILKFYNSDFYLSQRKESFNNPYTCKDLCKELKIDKKLAAKRASELGFTNFKKPKESDYSEEELKILEIYASSKTTLEIKRILKEAGFTRSIISINVKLTRLALSRKLNGSGDLNITLLAKAMGVDTHFFTEPKRLAKLKPTFESNQYVISRNNLRQYIIENPYDFNMAKVDAKFIIDLLAEPYSKDEQNS